MYDAHANVIEAAKKLLALEKKFSDMIKSAHSNPLVDTGKYFNDAFVVSRESYHTLRQILVTSHPHFISFIKAPNDDVHDILKDIIDGGNKLFSVYWYELLIDIVNDDRDDQQIFSDEAIDYDLAKRDKSEIFKTLIIEMDKSAKAGTLDHSTLFTDIEFWMDEHNLTMELDIAAPEYWIRLLKIGPILINKEVPKNVQEIYSEVRLNYANNHLVSCLALCRATLECCIYTKLAAKKKNLPKRISFNEIIEKAYSIALLDEDTRGYAHDVKNLANQVLHCKESEVRDYNDDMTAIEAIEKTRKVLEYLCRSSDLRNKRTQRSF